MARQSPVYVTSLFGVVVMSSILALTINLYADYPWVHYFERPDMARIHTAFPDDDGGIIAATGDWRDWHSQHGYNVWEYFSTGVFRINCETIENLVFPDNSYVLDWGYDSERELWVLIGEGRDFWDPSGRQPGIQLSRGSDFGFGYYRGAGAANVVDRRLGVLEGSRFVERSDLTDAIPGEACWMGVDPRGRIFVLSELRNGYDILDTYVSWWEADAPQVVHTAVMSEVFTQRIGMSGYPFFDRDGLLYMVVLSEADAPSDIWKYSVISLNPETYEWHVYDDNESEFLDSAITHFFIDPMDVKWFGTENGLVRFDGENWSCFTTENSQLPFNVVVEMAYDEHDDTYYVISQEMWEYGDYEGAFNVFSSTGEPHGGPIRIPPPLGSLRWRWIWQGSDGTWWIRLRNTNTVYSYDHQQMLEWDANDWVDSPYSPIYVGGTASQRTFAVYGTWLMIW